MWDVFVVTSLRILLTSFSSLSLSRLEVNPHQAEEAHRIEARVVIRATTCNWIEERSRDLSVRKA